MPASLAVYMPVYNAASYLPAAIESILAQEMRDFSFVIVDDGSTDASPDIIRGYASRDSRIVAVFAPHRGLVPTIDEAIARVDAPLLARMDADDISLPARLAAQMAYLVRQADVALVGCQADHIDATGRVIGRTDLPNDPAEVAATMMRYNAVVTPATIVRTAVHRAHGGFRPEYSPSDDYDLWLRISERHKIANLPKILFQYRVHSSSLSHENAIRDAIAASIIRRAGRLRRAGAVEPIARTPVDHPDNLAALGVTRAELDRDVGEFMLGKAFTVMARDPALAESYLAAARDRLGAIDARRLVTLYRGCVEGAWAAGRPLAAARFGAKMVREGMAWVVGSRRRSTLGS